MAEKKDKLAVIDDLSLVRGDDTFKCDDFSTVVDFGLISEITYLYDSFYPEPMASNAHIIGAELGAKFEYKLATNEINFLSSASTVRRSSSVIAAAYRWALLHARRRSSL